MNPEQLDITIYSMAKAFLPGLGIAGVTPDLIEKYLHLSSTTPRPKSIAGVNERILESAQNSNMKAGVIGGSVGGVDKLGPVLFDFVPIRIIQSYSCHEDILGNIEIHVKPRGRIRKTRRSLWPKYCQTILSSARFLSQFRSADDFYEWVNFFDQDERSRPALPMLLAEEIDGFGFALACDFLKELGYENFSKPDVHVKEIFRKLGLSEPLANDYGVFKAIARVARHARVTPYNVDKLFWLIGSGKFYDDAHIGQRGRIGRHKAAFVRKVKTELRDLLRVSSRKDASGL